MSTMRTPDEVMEDFNELADEADRRLIHREDRLVSLFC